MRHSKCVFVLTTLAVLILASSVGAQNPLIQRGLDMLGPGSGGLTQAEMSEGLKEALRVGTDAVVSRLGVPGGFSLDEAVHIPIPGQLRKVQKALQAVGQAGLADDLESKMNQAAEQATPRAKALFMQAIQTMTIQDVSQILNGPDDAATSYFRRSMAPELAKEMQPVVGQAMAESGAVQAYDTMMGRYEKLPFVPDVKTDLNGYVVEKCLDGIFHYVAVEEAAIRKDPARRTTDLLRKVFGK
ncbi:MAG: DUF4197 domain-containing protein [Deltaproteobacteria bacterium]|nr:DUF4197 domain-containing protein [Deltaproteobacteria bacterium]